MLHKYRKTALIKAEKFDGTIDMMREYGIRANPDRVAMYYTIPTKEGNMIVNVGDYIATGVDDEHWCIAKDIFERTYERCD